MKQNAVSCLRPGFLCVLLAAAPFELHAMDLVRLTPATGSAGSVLTIAGKSLGSSQGDWSIVLVREGSTKRLKASVLSWSSSEVRVKLPTPLQAGTYELFAAGPPEKRPSAESNRLRLGIVPQLSADYQTPPRTGDLGTSGIKLRGDLVKPPDGQSTGTGLHLSDEVTGQWIGDPLANCPDPALLSAKPVSPTRRSDGSYDFLLHVNVRNSGGGTLIVPKTLTLLIVLREGRELYKNEWSSPVPNIKLRPGETHTEDVRLARFKLKKNDPGLTAEIDIRRPRTDELQQADCRPENNVRVVDGATLTRALAGSH